MPHSHHVGTRTYMHITSGICTQIVAAVKVALMPPYEMIPVLVSDEKRQTKGSCLHTHMYMYLTHGLNFCKYGRVCSLFWSPLCHCIGLTISTIHTCTYIQYFPCFLPPSLPPSLSRDPSPSLAPSLTVLSQGWSRPAAPSSSSLYCTLHYK